MGTTARRWVTLVALAGLLTTIGLGSAPATARSAGRTTALPSIHWSGKPLVNPKADLSSPSGHRRGTPLGQSLADPSLGDAHRFDSWSGYDSKRYPEAVATGDFDQDGDADVAYARSDFFSQGMTIQLNLGDGTMGRATSYPSATESSDIKAGDVNGDGTLDLVMVSMGSSLSNDIVDVYLNDGHAQFTHSTSKGGNGPQKMALADLDGDGDLDLAMSSGYFQKIMSVMLNDGAGTFGPERRYTVGNDPLGVAAADWDGDGDVDLAVGRNDSSTLKTTVDIWSNDGSANFTKTRAMTLQSQGEPSLVADDFDGDGTPDLAVGLVGTDNQVILLNQGGLVFGQTLYRAGFSAWDLTSGDLDADGDADVVLATLGSSSTGDMSILRNQGDGTFRALRFSAGFNPHDAAIADFDRDGRADIVVANGATMTGGIHLQRRGFKFGAPPLQQTELFVGSLEPIDFDHDGDKDLAVSEGDPYGGTGFIQILQNDGRARFTPGQSIESGLSSRGGIGHVQPADLNGDGWDDLVWTISQFNEPNAPIVFSLNDGHGIFLPFTILVGTDANGYAGVADVDNDGDLDLVVSQSNERIAMYLGHGDATFDAPKLLTVPEFPGIVISPDLNGDGWADLATVHNGVYGSSRSISVLLGLGGGRFGAAKKYTVGQGPIDIVAADFDGDGDLDLATSNNGGDDISNFNPESTTVLLNRGNGQFGPITALAGEAIYSYLSEWAINTADVDGDGNLDLLVANALGNNVGVYYGLGDGGFEPQQVRYGVQNGAQDMTVDDFNADGWPDVVTSGYLQSVDPLFPPRGIVVLTNTGA